MRISDWSSDVCSSDLLNVKVKLVPNDKGNSENAPDFRLQAAGHDIGAAWNKTSEAGREYKSVTLDDPSFPAPVYARLIEGEDGRSEEHTSELQSLMRISYAVFCLKKKNNINKYTTSTQAPRLTII